MALAAPSSSDFSHFVCEEATVLDVNRQNWTCRVATTYSSKVLSDVPWSVPYHHFADGEGFHFMPEPGAKCYLAQPNDQTPAFIMCFVAPPAQKLATSDAPLRQDGSSGGGSDVSYQSKRPDLNPGDIALTTRDGNFLILRRGGVVQLGATPLAQRVVVPVRNFVHDYAENYELATPGGDVSWIIDRPELDATGQPASSYTFHLREFATDKNATVRVRHLPLAAAGGKKSAWEVHIAPNKIDTQKGAVGSPVYTMMVLLDGTKAEMVGANRTTEVQGDDELTVHGKRTTTVDKDDTLHVNGRLAVTALKDAELSALNLLLNAKGNMMLSPKANFIVSAKAAATIGGTAVQLGGPEAVHPAVYGDLLVAWLASAVITTQTGGPGAFAPSSLALLQEMLSKTVFLK